MEGIFPYILPPHRVRVRVLRRFGLNKGVNFAYFGLNSGMVFEGIRECMNVFFVFIPNAGEFEMGLIKKSFC